MSSIKEMVDKIIEDAVIDKEEYAQLMKSFHEDGKIDSEEKEEIGRLYTLIKEGKITIEE